ncbi:hypothetical protein RKD33_000109 [Streptomyces sp. SAI-129]
MTASCGAASHSRSEMSPEEISAVRVPVTASRPRAASTPVPTWQASRPAVATRSTRQAIFNERSTSAGRRRAIVTVVICAPA